MPYFLKVLSSPGNDMDGIKIELADGETLAGRIAPPAQIKLEGKKVSKKHCLFTLAGEQLKVADLKSSNGIFVNGKKVENSVLRARDRLVIGEFVLEVGEPAKKPGADP